MTWEQALRHVQDMYSLQHGQPKHKRFSNLVDLIKKKFGSVDPKGLSQFINKGFEAIPVLNTKFSTAQVTKEFQRVGRKPFANPADISRALAGDRTTRGALRRASSDQSYFLTVSGKTNLRTYIHEYLHYLDDVLYPMYVRLHHQQVTGPISDNYAGGIESMIFPREHAEWRAFSAAKFRTTDYKSMLDSNPHFKPVIQRKIDAKEYSGMTQFEYLTSPGEFRSFIWELFPKTPANEQRTIQIINKTLNHKSAMMRAFAAILDPDKATEITAFLTQLASTTNKKPSTEIA